MKKVYVSVPITGQENLARKRCEDFKIECGENYREIGCEIITPFDVVKETDKPYSYYIGEDLKVLLECDMVVFLKGWSKSKGCRLERAACELYDIPFYGSKN